jgi:hypothetical protein
MTLSTSQRFTLKKRIMDMLNELPHRDVELAIEEFHLYEPNSYGTFEDLIAQTVRGTIDDDKIEELHATLLEHERERRPAMADFVEGEDNRPFTPTEQQQITEVLDKIRQDITETHDLNAQQLRLLTSLFASLMESAKHDGRTTWLVTAVSVISGPVVSAIITPDGVDKVLKLMQAGIGALFGHPLPMLGP